MLRNIIGGVERKQVNIISRTSTRPLELWSYVKRDTYVQRKKEKKCVPLEESPSSLSLSPPFVVVVVSSSSGTRETSQWSRHVLGQLVNFWFWLAVSKSKPKRCGAQKRKKYRTKLSITDGRKEVEKRGQALLLLVGKNTYTFVTDI